MAACISRASLALVITPKFAAPENSPRKIEVRVIERIVNIETELNARSIVNRLLLLQGNIKIRKSRADDDIPACVSETILRRQHKRRSVEPLVKPFETRVRIADEVGPLQVDSVHEPDMGHVLSGRR